MASERLLSASMWYLFPNNLNITRLRKGVVRVVLDQCNQMDRKCRRFASILFLQGGTASSHATDPADDLVRSGRLLLLEKFCCGFELADIIRRVVSRGDEMPARVVADHATANMAEDTY